MLFYFSLDEIKTRQNVNTKKSEGSNVFEFTKFPFETKYDNTAVYSANCNYLFSRGKHEKNC